MGDVSTEPTMEEILSSIKRVIEESETTPAAAAVRPRRAPAMRTNMAEDLRESTADSVLELSDRAPFPTIDRTPPAPPQDDDAPAPVRAESILSPDAAEASRGPLEALSRMIVKPETAGGDTLEGMVREMLRPMLREWLDAQLPSIVEAMVAKEIARISGRGL